MPHMGEEHDANKHGTQYYRNKDEKQGKMYNIYKGISSIMENQEAERI